MVDLQATLFRFQQFVFEFGPFFLAAWGGLAVTTGLITVAQRKGVDLKAPGSFRFRHLRWMRHALFSLLWRHGGEEPASSTFSGLLIFSLAASVPALVVTSLIDMETMLLRLLLAALYALSLGWFVSWAISLKRGNLQEQRPETEAAYRSRLLEGDSSTSQPGGLRTFAQATWKSFSSQVDKALIPLVIGFVLASALTIYVPAYTIRPWLGEGAWQGPYLAALLATPFQLAGGAEVPLASALLVKGASLGAALSVLLVAPSTIFFVIRRLYRSLSLKAMALYLVAAWLVAGSLGAIVDGVQ